MKKRHFIFIVLFLIIGGLAACSSNSDQTQNNASTSTTNSSQTEEVAENHVRITVSINDGEEFVTEDEVPIEDGDNLLDKMEEHFFIEQESGFITSIERVQASEEEKTAWIYSVNGETPNVGAADYELESGDKVVFDLQPWE
ncbi:DUF4430 domain-containing protein [Oceanobacillus halophilus]|uniref:DUF4430 domain-containing protein n=1 Tax=Oceanobacillus halophilus TaxID=930130 RepID=A0A495AG89_9BACI|nr:DUF4430 domain-containing protein [Oceanobacillus halophilus]RKQ37695.1 DUF4430 domain-containing protein [Oceanobacillus halophilus]